MNQLQKADNVQAALRQQGKPHYLAHPDAYALTHEEFDALQSQQVARSLSNIKDYAPMTVAQAFEGTPIHVAMKVNEQITTAALVSLFDDALASVKVQYKIDTPQEVIRCIRAMMTYKDFTIEDWKVIMERIRQGTRKRYNKFEQADVMEYFVEYAEQKAEVREQAYHNSKKEHQRRTEQFCAEFVGDFRTPEERARDRKKGPQNIAELMRGVSSLEPYELAEMRQRDRERQKSISHD
jgi:hypothetical protein